jgi:hypothetical protein
MVASTTGRSRRRLSASIPHPLPILVLVVLRPCRPEQCEEPHTQLRSIDAVVDDGDNG